MPEMLPESAPLLLTILSAAALWALLTVLVIGLFLVLKTLQSVRGSLERIAFGVRAIETQTGPLGAHADDAAGSLGEAGAATRAAAERLAATGRELDTAAPSLRTRQ